MFWHPRKILGHLKAPSTPWVGLWCKRLQHLEDRIFNLIEYGWSARQCVTNITAGSGQLCSPARASDSHRLFRTAPAGVSVWAGGTCGEHCRRDHHLEGFQAKWKPPKRNVRRQKNASVRTSQRLAVLSGLDFWPASECLCWHTAGDWCLELAGGLSADLLQPAWPHWLSLDPERPCRCRQAQGRGL